MCAAPLSSTGQVKHKLCTRPDDLVEPCSWLIADDEGRPVAGPTQQVRMRSLSSLDEASLVFCNNSDRPARAVWLNFDGDEIAYSVIEPGQTKKYRTYKTHPWIMRDAETGERLMLDGRMVVFGEGLEQKVSIRQPPQLQWSVATHKLFPVAFRSSAKALLLAHNRGMKEPAVNVQSALTTSPPLSPAQNAHPSGWEGATGPMIRVFLKVLGLKGSVQAACNGPTAAGDTLCDMPASLLATVTSDVVVDIISFMAPSVKQCITIPGGHPDILPALLPSDPATWAPFVRSPPPAPEPAAPAVAPEPAAPAVAPEPAAPAADQA